MSHLCRFATGSVLDSAFSDGNGGLETDGPHDVIEPAATIGVGMLQVLTPTEGERTPHCSQ